MKTTVTTKNMVTIPAQLSRKLGITPGCLLDWIEPEAGSDEIRVRVIPTRAELAKRLFGRGARYGKPNHHSVESLIDERAGEDGEEGLS